MNILLLVNELRYTCGVTNHILHLAKGLLDTGKVNLWIICGGGEGISRFSDQNVNIISDERFLHKNRSYFGYISAINFLTGFVRKSNIGILHSHSHYTASIAKRTSQLTKAATIQTNHGLLQTIGRLKPFNADNYIVINDHINEHIRKNRIAPVDKINYIRCGIPVDKEYHKDSGKLKVIAASRFTFEKGLDTYIDAVQRLKQDVKEKAAFYIAGEGRKESYLIETNQRLNAGIIFLGRVADIYSLLRTTHILVCPSISKSEGFPAIITEAGATGNLVISSDFDGADSIIEDKVNGVLFRQGDPIDLETKLREAINGYDKYSEMASRFHKKISEVFDLDLMIEKHIHLYEKCLRK
ncbi:MAG: glycosyltransferase family 4 protein [Ignavibacteria bacterium]|nr:glycosyltransferase family 4 protein [Ignavibacteria bacterium]